MSYGTTVTSGPGYYRLGQLNLSGLRGNATYHYRFILTNPVGTVTTTNDFTFTTGAVPDTAPVAQNQSVMCGHDMPKAISLLASDSQGTLLAFTIVSPPSHGSVTVSGSTTTYTPAPGFSGSDSFTFTADNGQQTSNLGTVSLTVMPTSEVSVELQQGLNNYTGAKDTTISGYGSEATENFGGATMLSLYSVGTREIALAFDLTSIPTGAIISSATLSLYDPYAANDQIRLYQMTHNPGRLLTLDRIEVSV